MLSFLNLVLLTEKVLKGRNQMSSDLWLMGKEVIKLAGEEYLAYNILFCFPGCCLVLAKAQFKDKKYDKSGLFCAGGHIKRS